MMTEVSLQPMTVDDLNDCWEIDQKCFVDGETYDLDTFHYLLTNPFAVARKIELIDGTMIAFAIGMLEPGGVGHVIALGVDPDWRRLGFGRQLMQAIEDAFHDRGARTARLEVRVNNRAAQLLYRRLGYSVTQRVRHYYTNGDDAYTMVKPLLPSRSLRGYWR